MARATLIMTLGLYHAAGRRIERIVVAFEAGRDGFWLARWLKARSIDAHVIHAASVAVSREHRRAKTDRLDSELLKRAFLGWARGERDHCKMVAIPTAKDEDAKRPNRERESLVGEQNRIINRMKAALIRLGIREEMPGERAGPFGQCSGSTRHDSIGVAVAHVPRRLGRPICSFKFNSLLAMG
jgi:transposase